MGSAITLEVCIDTPDALDVCVSTGVDRVELCSALELGGLTPSAGLMKLAARPLIQSALPVYAMIRARAGDFEFSLAQASSMLNDIALARDLGLSGVVLGASNSNRQLDIPVLSRQCRAAGPMGKTLHRVIDTLDDPLRAIDQAVDLGFERILSSGGASSVADGLSTLARMHTYANGRIDIMAGAGLTPAVARLIRATTGVTAFHASCRRAVLLDSSLNELGFGQQRFDTDEALIRAYAQLR